MQGRETSESRAAIVTSRSSQVRAATTSPAAAGPGRLPQWQLRASLTRSCDYTFGPLGSQQPQGPPPAFLRSGRPGEHTKRLRRQCCPGQPAAALCLSSAWPPSGFRQDDSATTRSRPSPSAGRPLHAAHRNRPGARSDLRTDLHAEARRTRMPGREQPGPCQGPWRNEGKVLLQAAAGPGHWRAAALRRSESPAGPGRPAGRPLRA
jgi:hypothetical protein